MSAPADRLDSAVLDDFRRQLHRLFARLRPDTQALEEQTRLPIGGREAGELSNAPMHLADAGSEELRHEIDAVLLENEEYLTAEVLAALDRVELGTFGLCEACGQRIMAERLEAIPYARHCVGCADAAGTAKAVNVNEGRPESWSALAPEPGEAPAERLARTDDDERDADDDQHAVGTPGGGSASGGLAGTNVGRGDPDVGRLHNEAGGGRSSSSRETDDPRFPQAGKSGGAIGGTPVGKRAPRQ